MSDSSSISQLESQMSWVHVTLHGLIAKVEQLEHKVKTCRASPHNHELVQEPEVLRDDG